MQKKYFGTDGIRGLVGHSYVNPEFVLKLGWAVGRVLANKERRKILIGKDTRISGYMLESALEAGLSAAGVDVLLLGPMPTPAIAYLTQTMHADAGIVISASHNLYEDNGIKFFGHDGGKLPDEVEYAIEAEIQKPLQIVASASLGKARRIVDAPGRYIEFCKATIPSLTRFSGLKIVVDCAEGATYNIAPNVFDELGAEVVAIGKSPDGFNINKECGSTAPEKLQALVLKEKADIGIALDGDGDRVILVDENGKIVNGDQILYIITKYRMEKDLMMGGIVGTVMSNYALEKAIQNLGLGFVRTKVGDRYVLEALKEKGWYLGGEPSGHIVCLDKTTTGDGIVAALQVLAYMKKKQQSLGELVKDLDLYPQVLVNVKTDNVSIVMENENVKRIIKEVEAKLAKNGRVLLRPSGTEPVIRVMVEGDDMEKITNYAEQIASCLNFSIFK